MNQGQTYLRTKIIVAGKETDFIIMYLIGDAGYASGISTQIQWN